jgi:hypothetical protein
VQCWTPSIPYVVRHHAHVSRFVNIVTSAALFWTKYSTLGLTNGDRVGRDAVALVCSCVPRPRSWPVARHVNPTFLKNCHHRGPECYCSTSYLTHGTTQAVHATHDPNDHNSNHVVVPTRHSAQVDTLDCLVSAFLPRLLPAKSFTMVYKTLGCHIFPKARLPDGTCLSPPPSSQV